VSGVLTFIFTMTQMTYEYQTRVDALEENLQQVEKTYVPALENALWVFNKKQIKILVDSMSKIPYVVKTEVVSFDAKMNFVSAHDPEHDADKDVEEIRFPTQKVISLNYQINDREYMKLGHLKIYAKRDEIVSELLNKTVIFLMTQFIKTLLISFFILGVIFYFVIRPMQHIRHYLDELNFQDDLEPLKLKQEDIQSNGQYNELFSLQESINEMVERINEGNAFREQTINEKIKSSKLQSIGVLTSGVAHDFNNILQGLINLNYLNLKKNKNPEIDINLKRNFQFLDRGKSLVDSMLLFSRNKKPALKAVDLIESLEEVIELGQVHRFGKMKIKLECDLERAWVYSSKLFLYQVFTNLLANASDAMKKQGGEVTVRVSHCIDNFMIEITDNGPGMPPEMLQFIFDPFFTTKEVGQGTGLGLSIVYGIVQDLKGDIKVSSQVGAGTTFHISFPEILGQDLEHMKALNQDDEIENPSMTDAIEEEEPSEETTEQTRDLICLVDDEDEILRINKEFLEDEGYNVRAYNCPKAFLEDLPSIHGKIKMVLTDYNMPGHTGLDVLAAVQEVDESIPVFLLSGFIDSSLELDKFTGHLLKPIPPFKVIELVQNHTV
jgi:signal transduction histidine kinase/CheY-like chemotaxis protein